MNRAGTSLPHFITRKQQLKSCFVGSRNVLIMSVFIFDVMSYPRCNIITCFQLADRQHCRQDDNTYKYSRRRRQQQPGPVRLSVCLSVCPSVSTRLTLLECMTLNSHACRPFQSKIVVGVCGVELTDPPHPPPPRV